INAALDQWNQDKMEDAQLQAVIEITDSRAYTITHEVILPENQSLQLRAANRTRPIIRRPDIETFADALYVVVAPGSHFTLDGLLIVGRGVHIQGRDDSTQETETQPWGKSATSGDSPVYTWDRLARITIRHSTLVPGWSLDLDCTPQRVNEYSLNLFNVPGVQVHVAQSILGTIMVDQDEVNIDPTSIHISDSILDATSTELEALSGPHCALAHAVLTIIRTTVFGSIYTHAIDLGENSIFDGHIEVGRRQRGCIRFSYVTPNSRTPRRYNCQPDLVEQAVDAQLERQKITEDEVAPVKERERGRVHPRFNSTHYGVSTYAKLAQACAEEIKRGADDQSEMGVFHDLYHPQRVANLQARLNEYTPAGMDVGIIIVD
ncbi:MAG: hypothetical protein GY869_21480, partial [Planctomycetes bacterium]|nr:hypothetical protein [Planctomycetota bacterium]